MRLGLITRYVLPTLLSPFSEPTFSRCFVADVMTSMPKLFADIHYAICIVFQFRTSSSCFLAINNLLLFLPFLVRLFQSTRLAFAARSPQHALNSLKYASALCLAYSSIAKSRPNRSFRYWPTVWLGLSIYCTIFNYLWDVIMDWGIVFNKDRVYLFTNKWVYVWAALSNFVARLGWAVYVSPDQNVVEQHVILLVGAAEIARRFQWALFRVENEHVKRYSRGSQPQHQRQLYSTV